MTFYKQKYFLFVVALSAIFYSAASAGIENKNEFKETLQNILEQSPTIESQRALLTAAKDLKASKSLYWTPNLGITLVNQTAIFPNTSTGNTTTLGANINLFKFGASELGRQAAGAKLRAEESRLSQLSEEVESEVAGLLFRLIQQRQIVNIRRGHVSVQQQSEEVAKERYRQGQLAEQEYEKAHVDLAASQVSLAEAKLAEMTLENELKSLTDSIPNLTDWPLQDFSVTKKARRGPENFGRSLVLVAEKEYFHKSAQSTWRSTYMPSLDLSGGWTESGYGPLLQAEGQWFAGLTLTIPLWDQWVGVAQSQESEAMAIRSELQLKQSIRQAQANIDSMDLRLQISKQNLESSRQSVQKLQALRNDSLKRFRMGRSSVNDLLIDETRYLEAENSLLNSMLSYHQLVVEACHMQNESLLNCF